MILSTGYKVMSRAHGSQQVECLHGGMCVGVYTQLTPAHVHKQTHTCIYTYIYICIYLYLESQSAFHVLVLKGKKNKVPGG